MTPAPKTKNEKLAFVMSVRSLAVSNEMVRAAQRSYEGNPEYGLSDSDMKKAIAATLAAYRRQKP